jgi:hypothetical protein
LARRETSSVAKSGAFSGFRTLKPPITPAQWKIAEYFIQGAERKNPPLHVAAMLEIS